ncbi:hypothetical protein [Paenibacillus durus]|uniref:hypothetical protein n=1 Tax=Paenibacillus durus TaxID=44251 RepID=UPI00069474C0|nr:hypothetical protein [Paenibacillus durus]
MRCKNRSKLKKITFAFLFLYTILCLSIIVPDYKACAFLYYKLIPNVDKIHAELQVTTGPMHYIDDEKSKELLKKIYAKIDSYEIELKGDTPYKYVDDPTEIGDLTVYGKFNGVTDRYKDIGYGDIPIFEVKYYDYLLGEIFSPLVFLTLITLPFFFIIILLVIMFYGKSAMHKVIKHQRYQRHK